MHVTRPQEDSDCRRSPALLRERQALELIPVSRATFRRWVRDGKFPNGFRLCGRIAVWRAADVYVWIEQHSPPGLLGEPR